ncbi:MAG: hypothetical protein RL653_4164 [Pseudomonadota bacterium]|jgi:predicted RNase H-like HicB family nuclease
MDVFPYRIVTEWSEEDSVFVARVPALGAAGHGPSPEKASREARKAAEGMLEVLREDGEDIPEPDTSADFSGRVLLRLPRWLHGALARRAREDGVSLNQEMVSLLASIVGKETSRG